MKKYFFKKIILYFLKKLIFSLIYLSNKNLETNINSLKYSSSIIHIEKLLKRKRNPVILDVGAHQGETIDKILGVNQNSTISCFEPSKANFSFMERKYKNNKNINAFNIGLGNQKEIKKFYENEASPISSFKKFDKKNQIETSWGIKKTKYSKIYNTEINTIDSWIKNKSLKNIDLLKIDTQGFELDVLIGAKNSLKKGIIKNIILEIIFVRVYEYQPNLSEVCNLLFSFNYKLNAILDSSYSRDGELLQADFLYLLDK